MSIFGMMRTSLSGMNAQSDRLSAVADNIANSNTIGYKKAMVQFSDLMNNDGLDTYQSGSVATHVRYDVSTQGGVRNTGDGRDLTIQGNGFFLVTDRMDGTGSVLLTRGGDFRPDKDGNLRNSAGMYLLSQDDNTSIVNVGKVGNLLQPAQPTGKVHVHGTLPFDQKNVEHTPFDPSDEKSYSEKTSFTVTGRHGQSITVPAYYVKDDKGWHLYVPKTYSPHQTNLKAADFTCSNLTFDGDGNMDKDIPPFKMDIIEDPKQPTNKSTINFDIRKGDLVNRGQSYEMDIKSDGHGDGYYKSYTVDEHGNVVVKLTNGSELKQGRIVLATVASPHLLVSRSGTTFERTNDTGVLSVGFPGSGVFGGIQNQQLEQSNADISSELTDMIESQREYTSNTKVFQAGSEIMEAVLNMVR